MVNIFKKDWIDKHFDIFFCLFLVTSTISIYLKIYHYDFVSFDDNEYVYENLHVKSGITLTNILWAFTAFHSNNWHPLTWISHMLDCHLYGLTPGLHHLTNLFFHIVNSLLLFFIFKQMTGSQWKSAFIAVIFALHPLHVESVVWISERKDVLSTFFWMLTIWSYIRYVKQPGIQRYVWILLFFILGLLCKPMVVTLPFVLILLDYWPLNRFQYQSIFDVKKEIWLRIFLEKVPLFILVTIFCFLTYYAQKHGGIVKSLDVFPFQVRIANAIVSYMNYIGKMIYPVDLAFLYPYHGMPPWWKIAIACLLFFIISFLALKNIRKNPYVIVGWLWYVGTLVPVIGLVQVGMQTMADRYTYIPSIGLLIIIGWGIPELTIPWQHKKKGVAAAAVIMISIFAAVTWKQIGYWKNSMTMLEHTIKVTSNNYIALDSLGVELFKQGRIEDAINYYIQSSRIYPNNPYPHFNLGVALYLKGHIEEAVRQYIEALNIESNYFKAHTNLGAALFAQGKTEEAVKHYLDAIRINPDFIDAHINLGIAFNKQGRIEDAIKQFNQALIIDPNNINVHFNLGTDLEKIGRIDEAINHYSEAVRVNPNLLEAQYLLGNALLRRGRVNEAIQHYFQVLRIKPDCAEAHNNLGTAFYQQGRIDESIDQYLQAIRIKHDYAEANNNLGGAYFLKGDIRAATSCFQEALRINPNYESAKNNLQKILMVQQ